MDIMFYEAFDEEASALQNLLPSYIDAGFTDQTIQVYGIESCPADFISIRTQSIVPQEWLSSLKGVLSRSAGFDHLRSLMFSGDMYRGTCLQNLKCGYLVDYCSRAVAEHAGMCAISLLRRLPQQMSQVDVFRRDGITGKECRGAKACVIGVGQIGYQIVDVLKGLRMDVVGVDIDPRFSDVEYVSLNDGIQQADVIVCALPLTAETEKMLNKNALSRVKHKPVLVNIARAEITPFEDVIYLLSQGLLGGFATDVYPQEDILGDCLRALVDDFPGVQTFYQLKSFSNVILTPHNAFNTQEAVLEKSKQSVEEIVLFLEEGRFTHEV